jgi:hypothetical protein
MFKKPLTWANSVDERPKLKKMDMSFGTSNLRCMYRAGSLRAVAEEMSNSEYKLDSYAIFPDSNK